jgi:hypothetical protein
MARFNFTIEDETGLGELASLSGRRSKADVVRDALSLYEHLMNRRIAGDKIFIGPNRMEASEFHVTTLEAAAKAAGRMTLRAT